MTAVTEVVARGVVETLGLCSVVQAPNNDRDLEEMTIECLAKTVYLRGHRIPKNHHLNKLNAGLGTIQNLHRDEREEVRSHGKLVSILFVALYYKVLRILIIWFILNRSDIFVI